MATQKACYTPNGDNRNTLAQNAPDGWFYAPCNNAAEVSMCCAIGPGRNGSQDICLENGLCSTPLKPADTLWRESCTDQTWTDPACLKLFVNGSGINATMGSTYDDNGFVLTDIEVTTCDDGSFCYGESNRDCCQQGGGVYLYNGEQVAFDPNATTTSTSSSATSSATSTSSVPSASSTLPSSAAASASSTPKPVPGGGLSTGAKAGIGVGVALGAILVLAVILFLFRRRRKEKQRRSPQEMGTDPPPAMLETQKPRHELPGPYPASPPSGPLSELDGSTEYSSNRGGSVKKKDAPIGRYA